MACNTAFLAVSLDSSLKTALHQVACNVASLPEENLGVPDVGFSPHDRDKLHMTFVFCADALLKLPGADLAALHAEISKLSQNCVAAGDLVFKGFECFPPEKMNLIIARFDAPGFLQSLRSAVWQVCLKYGVAMKDDSEWTAHVTLGKIKATKAEVGMVSCTSMVAPVFPRGCFEPVGIALLGARPKQAWLDWDEALLFPAHSSLANEAGDSEGRAPELADIESPRKV